ncbi:DUF58 domain-containing protein [Glaciecola petra]|uniref:DUF58 domain-containing protein n=1 Tax=Glaciecola petra TaxID=3075602 RepID=A0ABU2ZQ39_9ALTE|nr:DUF58 domain-containing protein [Aestuariibacter sp. P117]MDT0594717.1 DUF58 domain-containing protein [Aestuariibacter sp. P117]
MQFPIEQRLAKLQTDGVNLTLPELVRYKPIAKRLNLNPASAIKSSMAGGMASRFKGRGMEFDEARHYQPGDDIRSIDWRVTARTGKTHTKVYREERERPVIVYLDLHQNMKFGTQLLYKSVQAVHASAMVTFSALARGDKIGCICANENTDLELKPKASAKHGFAMLNQIVNLHNQSQQSSQAKKTANTCIDSINKLAVLAKPGTLVYVISDFSLFDQACFDALGNIQRHCEIRPLYIYDPIEMSLPHLSNTNDVLLTDGLNEQNLTLGDKDVENAYSSTRLAWLSQFKQRMQVLGINVNKLNAAHSVESQMSSTRAGLVLGDTL